MITERNYLKSIKMMNEKEKESYIGRVDKWTEETYPRLAASVDSWTETDVKDYDEGLLLCSALQKARSFVTNEQRYDIQKRLKYVRGFLMEVREKSGLSKVSTRPANDKKHYRAVVQSTGKPKEDGTLKKPAPFAMPEVDNRRPEHLSQYFHLLPGELQNRAKNLDSMYLALAEYRGRAERLAENPQATKEQISEFAKKAAKQEDEINDLWEAIDKAYARATGQVGDDGEEDGSQEGRVQMKTNGEYTKQEIDNMEDSEMKGILRKSRIDANKKYVKRTDVAMSPERIEQIKLRISELLAWNEYIPQKAKEICKEAGIVVPGFNDDEQEPTSEEAETEEITSGKKADEKKEVKNGKEA